MGKGLKVIIPVLIGIILFFMWQVYYDWLLNDVYKFEYIFENYINISEYIYIVLLFVINCFIPSILNLIRNEMKKFNISKINYNLSIIIFGIGIIIYGIIIAIKDTFLSFFFLYVISCIINIGVYFIGNILYKKILLGRIFSLMMVIMNIILILYLL